MIGFVYIITNPFFASDVYKIGCTERAPHARADELSKGTGIPAPFNVLCYIEVDEFQVVERQLHEWMAERRISSNREWFQGGLAKALGWMWWYPNRLGFHSVLSPREGTGAVENAFLVHVATQSHIDEPDGPAASWSIADLTNPWRPASDAARCEQDVVDGGSS